MVLIIHTKNASNLTIRDMVPDGRIEWTDGGSQNCIPPTELWDN